MTNLLPPDYEIPASSGNYMKFEEGENTFRILSSAVVGWVGWTDKKPQRFRMEDKPTDLRQFDKQKISHFWAMVVWSEKAQRIQVLEVTQKGIQNTIKTIVDKWGSPSEYNITVNAVGAGTKEVDYSVVNNPKTELDLAVKETYDNANIDLEELFSGGDPFAPKDQETPPQGNTDAPDMPEDVEEDPFNLA